jgi:micrococcal nuclease
VVDGDTLQLADGRTVRLLAVDAPLANECAGPGATSFTRSLVEGKKVKIHAEPGTHTDDKSNLWRYVSYPEYMDCATKAPIYAKDLGNELVLGG